MVVNIPIESIELEKKIRMGDKRFPRIPRVFVPICGFHLPKRIEVGFLRSKVEKP